MHSLSDIGRVSSAVVNVGNSGTLPRPIALLHLDHKIVEVRLLLRHPFRPFPRGWGGGTDVESYARRRGEKLRRYGVMGRREKYGGGGAAYSAILWHGVDVARLEHGVSYIFCLI